MKTANVTTKNNANVAQTGQEKSSRNRIAAPVPEATRQFIISTTGSEVIEPIPGSEFCRTIVDFAKAGSKQTCGKYRLSEGGTITVVLPDNPMNTHIVDERKLQRFVGQKLYEGFKRIFLGYVSAYMRGGGKNQMQAILDFCSVYQIETGKKLIKMLKNLWHRSAEKKELNKLPPSQSLEKN